MGKSVPVSKRTRGVFVASSLLCMLTMVSVSGCNGEDFNTTPT